MDSNLESYANFKRDTKLERELVRELKAMPPEQAQSFLIGLLAHNYELGVVLCRSAIGHQRFVSPFFRAGLSGRPHQVGLLVDCCAPKLGFARTVRILESEANSQQEGVKAAIYYLHGHAANANADAKLALRDLEKQLEEH